MSSSIICETGPRSRKRQPPSRVERPVCSTLPVTLNWFPITCRLPNTSHIYTILYTSLWYNVSETCSFPMSPRGLSQYHIICFIKQSLKLLWNLAGALAAVLLKHLPYIQAIGQTINTNLGQSLDTQCLSYETASKFDRHLSSRAPEIPPKFWIDPTT